MNRRLTLKAERLTELLDAELAAIAAAQQGVPTKDCIPTKLHDTCPTTLPTGLNTECNLVTPTV